MPFGALFGVVALDEGLAAAYSGQSRDLFVSELKAVGQYTNHESQEMFINLRVLFLHALENVR